MKYQKSLKVFAVSAVIAASLAMPSRLWAQAGSSVSDAEMVANALISRQIQPQLQDFSRLVQGVSVEVEHFQDKDVVTLEGVVLVGDIACGYETLTIEKTSAPATFGFGRITVYHATVEKHLNKHKQGACSQLLTNP